ncbi:hypothetical protein mmcaprivi_01340 [Mycoplasma mycoides]|nr:hypothetical protein mmcaprivi_01340 [Mycoplasma mycoides]
MLLAPIINKTPPAINPKATPNTLVAKTNFLLFLNLGTRHKTLKITELIANPKPMKLKKILKIAPKIENNIQIKYLYKTYNQLKILK